MSFLGAFVPEKRIRLARKIVKSAVDLLNKQKIIIVEQILTAIKQVLEKLVSGVWVGKGANAFIDDVCQQILPSITRILDDIDLISNNIGKAIEAVDEADAKISSNIDEITDLFNNITQTSVNKN